MTHTVAQDIYFVVKHKVSQRMTHIILFVWHMSLCDKHILFSRITHIKLQYYTYYFGVWHTYSLCVTYIFLVYDTYYSWYMTYIILAYNCYHHVHGSINVSVWQTLYWHGLCCFIRVNCPLALYAKIYVCNEFNFFDLCMIFCIT
jgi:hypothetical protein